MWFNRSDLRWISYWTTAQNLWGTFCICMGDLSESGISTSRSLANQVNEWTSIVGDVYTYFVYTLLKTTTIHTHFGELPSIIIMSPAKRSLWVIEGLKEPENVDNIVILFLKLMRIIRFPAICSGGCNSENGGGTCVRPEICQCSSGWMGSSCDIRTFLIM